MDGGLGGSRASLSRVFGADGGARSEQGHPFQGPDSTRQSDSPPGRGGFVLYVGQMFLSNIFSSCFKHVSCVRPIEWLILNFVLFARLFFPACFYRTMHQVPYILPKRVHIYYMYILYGVCTSTSTRVQ